MLRASLFWKIFASFLVLIVFTAGLAGWIATRRVRADVEGQTGVTLRARVELLHELFADGIPPRSTSALQERVRAIGRRTDTRVTLIAADGTVVADSARNPAAMDNHGTRPEVLQSRDEAIGRAQRSSDTLQMPMVYMARAVRDGGAIRGYVRGAIPLGDLETRLAGLRDTILGAALVAALVALAGALLAARRLTRPLRSMRDAAAAIAAGDYERRVRSVRTDELGDLGRAFDEMAARLEGEISTIRRDRHALNAILDGMVEGVVAVDPDGRVVRVNDAARDILKMTEDAVEGREVWDVLRPYEAPEAMRRALRRGEAYSAVMELSKAGQIRTVRLHTSPRYDENGRAHGAIFVLNDITERRRLEEVRREFVANASHELKTPVASIRGMVETVLSDPDMDGTTRRRFLDRILTQSGRLGDLIDEMLVLSRLETEGDELRGRHALDVRTPVRAALDDCEILARERSIGVQTEIPDQPLTINAQPEAVRRIASNLLRNAVAYTPRGGRVHVRLRREDGAVLLEVVDTGIGIPADKQDRIFERFYRIDGGRARGSGGTGLGLAIVKHFVTALGGDIELESTPGGGSTFRVAFPAA